MNCMPTDSIVNSHTTPCQEAQRRWTLFEGKGRRFNLQHLMSADQSKSKNHAGLVRELQRCGNSKELERGRIQHLNAIQCGCSNDIYVANTLISMYSKCGSIHEAQEVFKSIKQPNVISWTALIVGYVDNRQYSMALQVFNSMDCPPNSVTFAAVFKALATDNCLDKESCLQTTLAIYRQVKHFGLEKDVAVASTLVKLLSKLGQMQMARSVFEGMDHRDVVSWNILMLGYIENGQGSDALEVFKIMDCAANQHSLVVALKACVANPEMILEITTLVHRRAHELGFEKDLFVASALVEMYSKLGNMFHAQEIFDEVASRDVVLWNVLVLGYVDNRLELQALEVFDRMDCAPNRVTFVAALKACAGLVIRNELNKKTCLRIGARIHARARGQNFDKDAFVASMLMNMYSKCGKIEKAQYVFDQVKERDVVCWNILMQAYAENGQSEVALEIFDEINCSPNMLSFVIALKACASAIHVMGWEKCLEFGVALHSKAIEFGFQKEVFVANSVIYMYTKCGDMQRAREVFDSMHQRDVVSWNVVILGYVENDRCFMALELLKGLDCLPNRVTFIATLKACASLGKLESGRMVHCQICEKGWEADEILATCLVDFYGKCGNIAAAERVFDGMPYRTIVLWTALIGGYRSSGLASKMFHSVKEMTESGLHMDLMSVQVILTTCSHTGWVEEGRRVFDANIKYGTSKTSVEQYTCMIDVLGRANKLEEALTLVQTMPFAADHVFWTTVLVHIGNTL